MQSVPRTWELKLCSAVWNFLSPGNNTMAKMIYINEGVKRATSTLIHQKHGAWCFRELNMNDLIWCVFLWTQNNHYDKFVCYSWHLVQRLKFSFFLVRRFTQIAIQIYFPNFFLRWFDAKSVRKHVYYKMAMNICPPTRSFSCVYIFLLSLLPATFTWRWHRMNYWNVLYVCDMF